MKVKEILLSLMNSELLVADIETSSLDFMRGEIGCITLANSATVGYYLPIKYFNEENKQLLIQVFKSAKRLAGANFKFDLKYLWKWLNIKDLKDRFYITDDIVQLSQAIIPGRPAGLKPNALYFTPFGGYDDALDYYKKVYDVDTYLQIPEGVLSKYATMDAIATYRIFVALRDLCHQVDKDYPNEKQIEGKERGYDCGTPWTIWRWYKEVMVPIVNDLTDLEYDGLYVSLSAQEKGYLHFIEEERKAKENLANAWKEYGVTPEFDFNSGKQMGDLLTRIGYDVGKSDKGEYELGDPILQDFVREGHTEIKYLQELRGINTILGTFIGGIPDGEGVNRVWEKGWAQYFRYHPEDDSWRLHTNFASMLAKSFRHRSTEPNFQNLAVHSPSAVWCKKLVEVPHTHQYRVKFNNKEYLFKHNTPVMTKEGIKLARELKPTDDLIEDLSISPFEVKKERIVRKVKEC
jgi:DNA polymerase I-like protein with 3'-5' exonuclease and polymerase domains